VFFFGLAILATLFQDQERETPLRFRWNPTRDERSRGEACFVSSRKASTEAQSRVCPHPGQAGCQKACCGFHFCVASEATCQDRQRREKAGVGPPLPPLPCSSSSALNWAEWAWRERGVGPVPTARLASDQLALFPFQAPQYDRDQGGEPCSAGSMPSAA
jgi:hypothetical protein